MTAPDPAAAVPEAQDGRHPFYVKVERILTAHDLREIGVTDTVESLWAVVEAASAAVREGERERLAAVEAALDIEGWIHDRGDFDRGVQAACSRIRRALADPQSFLNPTPAAAPSLAAPEGTEQ